MEHVSKTDVDDGRQETTVAITTSVSSGFAITTVPSGFAIATVPSGFAIATVPSGFAIATVPSGFAIATVPSGFATWSYLSPAILSAIAFRWRHCALVITLFS